MSEIKKVDSVLLPDIINDTYENTVTILKNLNVPPSVIASKEEIFFAYKELPRELSRIDPDLRGEFIARMVIAISVGLFDGAINYIWNSVIINLRNKIKTLGFETVSTILNRDFNNKILDETRDSDLLTICLKLDLINQNDYFMLNQNREIRNAYSSAHPKLAQIDDRELINFISRCCKHGLNNENLLKGVSITDLLTVIKSGRLSPDRISVIIDKLNETIPMQQLSIIQMFYGLYCSDESSEETRLNCLDVCIGFRDYIDDAIKTEILKQHDEYRIKGDDKKIKVSITFFTKMEYLSLLSDSEKHGLFYKVCNDLHTNHNEFNNFYNEPPYAEKLDAMSRGTAVPNSMKSTYVYTIVESYLGNAYGVSNDAIPFYENMIKRFSPIEIDFLLKLPFPKTENVLSRIMKNSLRRRKRYIEAINLVDVESLTPSQKALVERIESL